MRLVAASSTAALLVMWTALALGAAEAASITSAYAAGHIDVTLNDYRATGLGTFLLTDGDRTLVALCVEADVSHSTARHAYRPVPSRSASPELDALIWLVARDGPLDDDEATAAAALAWYWAGARRTLGPPVWSDWSRGFAAISPIAPNRWDELPPFSASHPVGLRAGGADLDRAEALVVDWLERTRRHVGPWTIRLVPTPSGVRVELSGPGGPIAGERVALRGGGTVDHVVTDDAGQARVVVPPDPAGVAITATATGPAPRQEWDGSGDVQRMITARSTEVTATWRRPPSTPSPTTAPATTAPPATPTTMPATTDPPSTTTSTSTATTSTTTTSTTTTSTTTSSTTTTTTIAPRTTATPPSTSPAPTTDPSSTTTPPTTTTPAPSIPPPSTTSPDTTSTSTAPASTASTSSTSSSAPTSGAAVPRATALRIGPTAPGRKATLPATGPSGGAQLLRMADLLFAVGVALTVTTRLVRR